MNRNFYFNKKLKIGFIILLFLIIFAIFSNILAPFDPALNNLANRLKPPNKVNIMGTDHLGRDVFSRIIYGSRISISISVIVLFISMLIGTTLGIITGYTGGIIDKTVMIIIDILLAFPNMVLSLGIAGLLEPGIKNMVIAICIVSWIGYCIMVRNMVLSIKEKDFIKAAIISNTPKYKIMLKHILPNIFFSVIIYAGTNISIIVMQVASLSFLGLGAQPPLSEWGSMLNDAKGYITKAPWLIIFPSLFLIIFVVGLNLFGEGLYKHIIERSKSNE